MGDETKMLVNGGQTALAQLFELYRGRLLRMLEFRLAERLRGRVDPEDILQEAYIELARRLPEFVNPKATAAGTSVPRPSAYVWIRQLTYQVMIAVQRRHFGQKRDPRQEIRAPLVADDDGTSHSILSAFAENMTSPSQALMREEEMNQLRSILSGMDELDREVVALRHFEQLSNNEIAEALGISVTAASNRYVRAMLRMSQIVGKLGVP